MTCVLLRGLTREQAHWGDFASTLTAALGGERVVALDLPGAGALRGEASPLRIASYVEACRAQAHALAVAPPFDLVGLSLGAMVAVAWAARYRNEVARSVLINTSMRPFAPFFWRLRPVAWVSVLRALASGDPRAREALVLALTSNTLGGNVDVVERWTAIALERPVSRVNALRQLWAAARFHAPHEAPCAATMLLASRGDRLVDVRCSRALAAAWHVPLHEHARAGHDLPLDDPHWVAGHLRAWLAGAHGGRG